MKKDQRIVDVFDNTMMKRKWKMNKNEWNKKYDDGKLRNNEEEEESNENR